MVQRLVCFTWMLLSLVFAALPAHAQEAPTATVLTPSFLTDYSVVLRARINPNGLDTRYAFILDAVSVSFEANYIGNGSEEIDVNLYIDGLKAGAPHTVFVRARNAAGTFDSEPLTINAPPSPVGSPSVKMLPSGDPKILRVEVDPKGQITYVELRGIYGHYVSRIGTLSGSTPAVIEHPLSYIPERVHVSAHSESVPALKSSGGILSTYTDFPREAPIPIFNPKGVAPAIHLPRSLSYNSGETDFYFRPQMDCWGSETVVEVFLNGQRFCKAYAGVLPYMPVYIGDLTPGTDYIVNCRATNQFGTSTSNDFVFKTLGTPPPGNKPPVGSIPVLRIPAEGGSASATITATDPEGKSVAIQSYTQGKAGLVEIDGWTVTYTPGANFTGSDEFYVILADDKGATSSITGTVIVEGSDDQAGSYDLVVRFNTDPPKPAGRLTLDKTSTGAFTGRLVIYGAEYPLLGTFSQEGVAILDLDRLGLPPLQVTLTTSSGVENERYLYVTIDAAELAAVYIAEGAPIGNSETNAEVAGFQYTAILPMRAAESETPQGDGYFTGTVTNKGQARFVGQTGDGQPFSIGGRLQRTRKLQIGISVGQSPRDYLQGHLEFTRDLNKTVRGELSWLSYRKTTEHYRKDFTRTLQPMGARYRPQLGLFGEIGGSNTAKVQLIGEDAVALETKGVTLKKKGGNLSAKDPTLTLKVNRKAGVFRGTSRSETSKRKFSGAVVQSFNRGGGNLSLGGPVGAVEVLPP
jgi:hypothetical protein